MPKSNHSAGEPGAARCSEAATGAGLGACRRSSKHSRMPNVRRPFPELPFITFTEQPGRNALELSNWFDVPAEDYGPGSLTGMQAFGEYMAAQRAGVQFHHPSVLEGVFSALQESADVPSRRGAAVGFVAVMIEWQQLAAGLVDPAGLVAFKRARLQQWLALDATREARQRADFPARLRAARDARAAGATDKGVHHG